MTMSLVSFGLSTAFGPSYNETRSEGAKRRSTYFAHPKFIGSDFKRQVSAFADRTTLGSLEERLPVLLAQAITDMTDAHISPSIPYDLVFCLPEAHAEDATPLERLEALAHHLNAQTVSLLAAAEWDAPTATRFFYAGQTGPIAAIAQMANAPKRALCLVALDSYNDRARLLALGNQGRLFSKSHPFGLVPGEAASVCLLLPSEIAEASCPRVLSAAMAHEPIGEYEDADSLFVGMTTCLQAATDALSVPVSVLRTDWNNSRYRAAEISYALHRLPAGRTTEDLVPEHITPVLGDIGAAYATTCLLMQNMPKRGAIAILSGAARSKDRGTLVVETG